MAGSDDAALATEATVVRAVGAAAAVYTDDAMEGTARREVAAPTCGKERGRGRWAQNVVGTVPRRLLTMVFLARRKEPGRCLHQESRGRRTWVSAARAARLRAACCIGET